MSTSAAATICVLSTATAFMADEYSAIEAQASNLAFVSGVATIIGLIWRFLA